jgi:hypothetical protein
MFKSPYGLACAEKFLCDSQIAADQYVVGLLFNELRTIASQTWHILKQNSDSFMQ